jgi:selenium donor protein
MIGPLVRLAGRDERVLVGPETGDDAGVFLLDGHALIATTDFITPFCDDPRRFGWVAAANSLSDVYAMGGRPLFVLNLCCFPQIGIPDGVLASILEGAAAATAEAGAVVLGGHSVVDPELKFGLAVVGEADRDRLLTNAGARAGERLVLTKPLGTGVLINAFKADKLDAEGLEPALRQMERLNAEASRLAVEHGVRGATDVTGFGLAGHALGLARASGVGIRFAFERLPVHESFYRLIQAGVSTGCTSANEDNVAGLFTDRARLSAPQREVLFDPQTSGGLLLSAPSERAPALLEALVASGHTAAEIGEVLPGPPRIEVV